jgi:mediator of RNA polymerase II transcription subunit 12
MDFLAVVCSALTNPTLKSFPEILQQLIDIAALTIDSLADEQRVMFTKMDYSRSSDPFLAYMLGIASTRATETWLGLVTSYIQQASTQSQAGTPVSSQQSQSQGVVRPGATRPGVTSQTSQSSQQQRSSTAGSRTGGVTPQALNKAMAPPVPFPLKPWEMLPDQSNVAAANDTAISLALFGARKV